jgi:deoxyadenosine/deoxycytidine kinase
VNTTDFEVNLDLLILLAKQKHNPTYNFFCKIKARFENSSIEEKREIYEDILSSSAIIQYGNFSPEEENAWNQLWEAASKELAR